MSLNCVNRITITCEKIEHADEIEKIVDELRLYNNPNEIYKTVYILERVVKGVVLNFCNTYNPDFSWLERILDKYQNVWIKNEWVSEKNKLAGVWVGYTNIYYRKDIKQLSWTDKGIRYSNQNVQR